MKKVFLSVPMKGLSNEDIAKEIKRVTEYAKIVIEDDEIEIVDTFVEVPYEVKNESVYSLGGAIQIMANCDVVFTPDYRMDYYKGCMTERNVAMNCGIPIVSIPYELLPEAEKVMREYYQSCDDVNCRM